MRGKPRRTYVDGVHSSQAQRCKSRRLRQEEQCRPHPTTPPKPSTPTHPQTVGLSLPAAGVVLCRVMRRGRLSRSVQRGPPQPQGSSSGRGDNGSRGQSDRATSEGHRQPPRPGKAERVLHLLAPWVPFWTYDL